MKRVCASFLLFAVAVLCSYARPSDVLQFSASEVTEIEYRFFQDINDGTLHAFTPFDAFLIASEITDEPMFSHYQKKLLAVRDGARKTFAARKGGDPYSLANDLLVWLHSAHLKTYTLKGTTAASLLDRGEYNCLSSSALYGLLAEDLGLRVEAVLVTEHSFCRVNGPNGWKDVETTTRHGFNPGNNAIIENAVVRVPRKDYGPRSYFSLLELMATVYLNRIILLQETQTNYIADLPKYKKAYYFNQRLHLIEANIRACFNNLANAAIGKGNYTEAEQYIAEGRRFSPSASYWDTLDSYLYSDKAAKYAEMGDYERAIATLREGLTKQPNASALNNNIAHYYNSWGLSYLREKKYANAIAVFETALIELPNNKTLEGNARNVYVSMIAEPFNAREYEKAILLADAALKRYPKDAEFTKIKINAITNIKNAFYNRAVIHVNAKEYAKAIAECEQGLAVYPNLSLPIDQKMRDLLEKARKNLT